MAKEKKKTKKKGGYNVFSAGSNGTAPKRSLRPRRKTNNLATADDTRLRNAVEFGTDGSRSIIDIEPDGNCLFRSISDQLYFDYGSNHFEIRNDACNFLQGHKDSFSVFLVLDDDDEEDASDFESYVQTMRQDGEWGGHVELVAASRMYRRNITVYTSDLAKYTIEHGSDKTSAGPDLLLSYHDNDHYNSVRPSTGGKPPPPIKTFALEDQPSEMDETTTIATNESEMELVHPTTCLATIASETNTVDVAKVGAEAQSSVAAPSKQLRNARCNCGSGNRYRKCCGVAGGERKSAWGKKQRKSEVVQSIVSGSTDEHTMDGTFRVLSI